jgi:N-acetyl-anhydromuramyl-L-alanine amidase AmpD
MAALSPNSVKYLILHCTSTPPSQHLTLEDVERLHRSQGCLNIKHHFVIQRDGFLGKGREINQIGLHANRQYNQSSIGILMVGGRSARGKPEDNYTVPQKETLAVALKALMERFPEALVVGWSDLAQSPSETCPNFDVKEWWAKQ